MVYELFKYLCIFMVKSWFQNYFLLKKVAHLRQKVRRFVLNFISRYSKHIHLILCKILYVDAKFEPSISNRSKAISIQKMKFGRNRVIQGPGMETNIQIAIKPLLFDVQGWFNTQKFAKKYGISMKFSNKILMDSLRYWVTKLFSN